MPLVFNTSLYLGGVPGSGSTVDQTYDPTSANAQSGVAVKEAVDGVLPSQAGNSGKFLTTDGTEASWETITIPSVDVDGVTVTKNASDELQASAVMNARTGTDAMPIWQGTQQQWTEGVGTDWYNWRTAVTYTRDFEIYSVYQINPVNDETKILTAQLVGNTYVYKQVNSTGLDNFNSLEAVIKIKFNTTGWPSLELFSVFGGSAMGSYPFVKLYDRGWSEYNGYNREKAFPDDKQIDTWYWLKVVYNNTTHTFTNSYSTDGINWTVASTRTVEFTIYPNNKYIGLGVAHSSSLDNSYFYYDLAECYVKVDDEIVWTPYVAGPYSECYTLSTTPETTDTVYSEPNTTSALTITSVGTGTITLSDNNTYTYTQSGDEVTYQSIGEAHPTWLCNINDVGVKVGNTLVADNTDTSTLQTKANLVTSVDSSSTDSQYPSAKLFYDTVGDIETLINNL